jgi:chromosome segregation protein
MILQKLEMHGFKSFADRKDLTFIQPTSKTRGITAIVGPNGSGKSNVADAIRWVLGEQSTKLLRGKKAEDVIFSGSEKRPRSGYAEVTLHFDNESGQLPLDFSEITIARRIYRDGESEYLINKKKVRLADIQLLLAQANFGARTYSVIGQGMVDSILMASPQERKEFFDEAAGVKQFQLKRHSSIIKLQNTKDNLGQAEMLINEIEPRVKSLSRQVKRLEQRADLEEELHGLHHQYYGQLWLSLQKDVDEKNAGLKQLEKQWQEKESVLEEARRELVKLEKEETGSDDFVQLQDAYQKLLTDKSALQERELRAKSKLEITAQVRKQTTIAMPLSKIIERVRSLAERYNQVINFLRTAKSLEAARKLISSFEEIYNDTVDLADCLERPAPEEDDRKSEVDVGLLKGLEELQKGQDLIEVQIKEVQASMSAYNNTEREKKAKFFQLQRGLSEKISVAHALERQLGDRRVDLARLETRRDALEQEMMQELGERVERVKSGAEVRDESAGRPEELRSRIEKLKYQLQLIGGIDPEVVKEFTETNERYEFLTCQVADLAKAIADLERIIVELDGTIRSRSEAAFRKLNREFDRYFKLLFGGGKAELFQIEGTKESDVRTDTEAEITKESAIINDASNNEAATYIAGVDITATPPGKKIKHINMLSGGERALTSIALICAIMTSNPSPFVVLDEVDAALDESNADKFASILKDLAERTQFIVVTHNRYTMNKADILYGVTMQDDGTSQLLSINMEEVEDLKNDRQASRRTRKAIA